MESNGFLESENWDVGHKAMKRGSTSLGTLGSGNHFLELQVVDRVVDEKARCLRTSHGTDYCDDPFGI